jgi:hypothetical protein
MLVDLMERGAQATYTVNYAFRDTSLGLAGTMVWSSEPPRRRVDTRLTEGFELLHSPPGGSPSADLRESGIYPTIFLTDGGGGVICDGSRCTRAASGLQLLPSVPFALSLYLPFLSGELASQLTAHLTGDERRTFEARSGIDFVGSETILSHQTFCYRFRPMVEGAVCLTEDGVPLRLTDDAGRLMAATSYERAVVRSMFDPPTEPVD